MSENTCNAAMDLLEVLQVIFIVLKLVGVINWPWITVLIPLWIELGIFVLVFLCWILLRERL